MNKRGGLNNVTINGVAVQPLELVYCSVDTFSKFPKRHYPFQVHWV